MPDGNQLLSKSEARARIWREMEIRGVGRFPGTAGRIPNFVGAERAALHLQELRAWREARAVKINPDAPQLPVRRMALREGKVVYMPVPRLRSLECFLELDPARLGKRALQAASIRGAERLGRPVGIEALPPIDLIVCGAVGVNARGARVGKGGGFSDLEYGLLVEAGRAGLAHADRHDGPSRADPSASPRDAAPRHPGRRRRHPGRADGPPASLPAALAACTERRWRRTRSPRCRSSSGSSAVGA